MNGVMAWNGTSAVTVTGGVASFGLSGHVVDVTSVALTSTKPPFASVTTAVAMSELDPPWDATSAPSLAASVTAILL